MSYILKLIIILLINYSYGVKLLQLRVPGHKLQSSSASLRCIFDLENSTLYSVKWYKDGAEFYRYTPADTPPGQSFPLAGVTVDLGQSDDSQVVLRLLTLDSSGIYRCEVSTEAPHFLTVSSYAYMLIMTLPKTLPQITGLTEIYNEGEPLEINCTSARSKPATILTWYINDVQVTSIPINNEIGPWLTIYRTNSGDDKLEQNILGLKIAVNRKFFSSNTFKIKLRCSATLGALQWHMEKFTFVNPIISSITSISYTGTSLFLGILVLLYIL